MPTAWGHYRKTVARGVSNLALRKLAVGLLVSGVLGFQLYCVLPIGPKYRNWYWPFVNFPMFSTPVEPGSLISAWELRAQPCAARSQVQVLTFRDLGVRTFNFVALLRNAGKVGNPEPRDVEKARNAQSALSVLLNQRFPGRFCNAELWRKSVVLETTIDTRTQPPWERVHMWNPRSESATGGGPS